MEMDRPSKAWSVVGKLAVVVTIVVGILQGLKLIRDEPTARVTATVKCSDFTLPPDLAEQFERFRKLTDSTAAKEFWATYKPNEYASLQSEVSRVIDKYLISTNRAGDIREFSAFSKYLDKTPQALAEFKKNLETGVASILAEYASSAWSDQRGTSMPPYAGLCRIEVTNTGGRQATNVELNIPDTGIATVETAGVTAASFKLNGTIVLGTILPQRTLTVRLWRLYHSVDSLDVERWRLSYAEGIGQISIVDWH
jgi:hypothetical protein